MSTFAEMKSNVSKEIGLDETASGTEDVLLGRRLNQAVRQVLRDTHMLVATGTVTLTADTNDYELPTTSIALRNLTNSDDVPLDRVSVEEIHELRRATQATGSNVWKYAVNGANLLMIYPTPGSAEVLTMYYVPKPTEMSSGTNDPSSSTYGGIPVEYHDLIEFWAAYRMLLYDESQRAKTFKDLYDKGIFEARRDMKRKGGRKLGPVRLVNRHRAPRDPSQT